MAWPYTTTSRLCSDKKILLGEKGIPVLKVAYKDAVGYKSWLVLDENRQVPIYVSPYSQIS
jgi:hypothetical protein